ncbi:MAG: hypothetical protein DRQ54_08015 [Gammaproteobacteria bacterium]|nr:MAG: hypothetical protein DRQ54_08015 [Gammaproteobacteria bacterium]
MVFNPRSRQLLAAVPSCREVAALRPSDGLEFAPFGMPAAPGRLALDPGHRKLLVVFSQNATLGIYDANRGSLQGMIELGGLPHAVVAP